MQGGIFLAIVALSLLMIGTAQRFGWIRVADGSAVAGTEEEANSEVTYTCPMHPDIRQEEPGKCPICGMTLVSVSQPKKSETVEPVSKDRYICPMMCTDGQHEPGKCPVCAMDLVKAGGSGGGGERSVMIDTATRTILGIRTAKATSGKVYRTLRSIGKLDYNEEQVATISAYVDGRLEELFAEYVGVKVAKGDDLALLYSPQLYSAQVEYLSSLQTPALDALVGSSGRLSQVARDNLSELGMTQSQIAALRSSGKAEKRLPIASPIGGTVITKHKVEGEYVKKGDPIYRVVDLSTVWLLLDLYPIDAAAIRYGQPVEAMPQSLPGEIYTGRVAFVDPMVNKKTRTVSVRVEMTNFDGRLRPGDYATATVRLPAIARDEVYDPALAGKWMSPMHPQIIRSQPGTCPICGLGLVPTRSLGYADAPLTDQFTVSIPRSAVLMAGEHSVVYVESPTEPGLFEIREVTLGPLTDVDAVVLQGIEVGETVATDGNFLIDSQMQLEGKPSLMDPGKSRGKKSTQPQGANHAH